MIKILLLLSLLSSTIILSASSSFNLFGLIKNGKLEIVQNLLIKANQTTKQQLISMVDENGRNALITSLERYQPEIARVLLEHGADVNQHDSKGHTALHWALYRKEIDIAETLIDAGADVNHNGPEGEMPALLWVAVHTELKDHDYLIHQLIDAGANVDARDSGGYTALAISSMNGHGDCVKRLLEKNADPNLISRHNHHSPLYLAAMNGYEHIVNDLINTPTIDFDIKDVKGFTALDIAKRNGRRKIATLIESAMNKEQQEEL